MRGAAAGGMLLGPAEDLAYWKLDPQWSEAVTFIVLFAFIIFRPSLLRQPDDREVIARMTTYIINLAILIGINAILAVTLNFILGYAGIFFAVHA